MGDGVDEDVDALMREWSRRDGVFRVWGDEAHFALEHNLPGRAFSSHQHHLGRRLPCQAGHSQKISGLCHNFLLFGWEFFNIDGFGRERAVASCGEQCQQQDAP